MSFVLFPIKTEVERLDDGRRRVIYTFDPSIIPDNIDIASAIFQVPKAEEKYDCTTLRFTTKPNCDIQIKGGTNQ